MKSQIKISWHGSYFLATLPLPPISNHRLIPVDGRIVLAKGSRRYINDIKKLRTAKPLEGDVYIGIVFFRQRNQGDIDGRLKSLFDALAGVMFLDDKQVVRMHVKNCTDSSDPRVEVECFHESQK